MKRHHEGHGYDLWMTPPEVLEELRNEFGSLFDPCPSHWSGEIDGLSIDWPSDMVSFVNPPYSQIATWAKKCSDEAKKGRSVILLIPSRTDTRYFHDYIYGETELRFFKGRLKFVHPDDPDGKRTPAPFPSMLCIWESTETRVMKAWRGEK